MDDQRLWEIADEFLALTSMLDEGDDEAVANSMELVEFNLQEKIDGTCSLIAAWKASEGAIDDQIKRLQARKKMFANRGKGMRFYLQTQLQRMNKPKIETEQYTVFMSKGRENIVIDDESKIPDEYITTTRTVNKMDLSRSAKAQDIKEGPGYHFERGADSLRIK